MKGRLKNKFYQVKIAQSSPDMTSVKSNDNESTKVFMKSGQEPQVATWGIQIYPSSVKIRLLCIQITGICCVASPTGLFHTGSKLAFKGGNED